ncbi:hypothetical protein HanIR_Chr11g0550221 [Helianthus annuus]|nr:hypothetical protein HanIR_Chr11g0550221 [Helianthus annuus]
MHKKHSSTKRIHSEHADIPSNQANTASKGLNEPELFYYTHSVCKDTRVV